MFYPVFIISSLLIGYLFGSLSWSIIIGKFFYKKDPRDFGSKNAGATNSMRVYGNKTALLILFLDIVKTIMPTIIIWLVIKFHFLNDIPSFNNNSSFNPLSLIYLVPFATILGHCYPIFFKFKGGKGAASFSAFLWLISPWIALFLLLIFLITLKKSKMVSFSVLFTTIFTPLLIFIPGINYLFIMNNNISDVIYFNYFPYLSMLLLFFLILISLFILFFKHKENIQRIIDKKERKINLI